MRSMTLIFIFIYFHVTVTQGYSRHDMSSKVAVARMKIKMPTKIFIEIKNIKRF